MASAPTDHSDPLPPPTTQETATPPPLPSPDPPPPTPADPPADWAAFVPRFPIGRGQFGVVYLLQHPDGRKAIDKRVQLCGLSAAQRRETENEAALLRRLAHAHVVRYLHSFTEAETLHLVMEYCGGGSLADAIGAQIERRAPFAAAAVRRWAAQLAGALAHVHSCRVIHRDVKPANVFLCDAAHGADLKLGDFGISRLLSSQTDFASTAVGTPYYLAPELIGGSGYDGRADVWSLGCILFELLALRRPFSGENMGQLAMAILRKAPAPLPDGTPHDLQELCFQLLRKEQALRPTAQDLLHSAPMNKYADAVPDATSAAAAAASESLTPDGGCDDVDAAASSASTQRAGGLASSTRGLRRAYQWDTSPESGMGGGVAAPHWQLLEPLLGVDVVQLAGSRFASVALSAAGGVFCWSSNPTQDMELSFARSRRPKELKVESEPVVAVTEQSLFLLTAEYELLQWDGSSEAPEPIRIGSGVKVVQISCGDAHCLAVADSGALYAWGAADEGQLGLGDFDDREGEPQQVELPEGARVRAVSCAGAVSLALSHDGVLFSCGNDEFGQLAHRSSLSASTDDPLSQTQEVLPGSCCLFGAVHVPKSVERIAQMACGPTHSAAITDDGRVLSWGLEEGGRLGRARAPRASASAHRRPAVLPELSDKLVTALCVSPTHALAFTAAGSLWVWGQVGRELHERPAQVMGEALDGAAFVHGCTTPWRTFCVASVPSPGGIADEGDGLVIE
ncbi:hypothetical protein AB1Y20_005618 [Prymnesium parvum]|uniref:non-specific serine/threonine protein kinase n=1 Tax=Prymnesium parvum TaxID=97485 RepID=A0AB34J4S9_PRYPA